MEKQRILVFEDNEATAENIRLYLEHHGYDCHICANGAAGLALLAEQPFHLVILDIMLPDMDGYQICERIRRCHDLPIIMLTARVEDRDLVKGLGLGADDYMKKPYSNKELVARVQAHLRRHGPKLEPRRIGPFTHHPGERRILHEGRDLGLTKTEYLLFEAMLLAPGRVFSRDQLCDICGEDGSENLDRTIDVHVHNLRKKVSAAGLAKHGIKAVYGQGYRWEKP